MNVNRNLMFEFDNVVNDNNFEKSTNNEEDNKINSDKTLQIKKKKKKKCKHCKSKKKFGYKTCEYCFKFYCVMCSGPVVHNCKNLEQYKIVEKEKLKNKLFSADCNFKKIVQI